MDSDTGDSPLLRAIPWDVSLRLRPVPFQGKGILCSDFFCDKGSEGGHGSQMSQ